jgi:hypothetical protein
MTNRLMITVAAAALIAGTGFANAQGTGMSRDTPSAAPSQQSAPSSDRGASDRGASAGGEMNRDAAKPAMKSTQSEQQSPAAGKNQRADEKNMPGQSKSSQNENSQKKSMSSENENNAKTGKDMKAEGGQDRNGMKAEGSEDRNGKMNADSKGGRQDRRPSRRRRKALNRAAHQDHDGDQGPARSTRHQRELLDFGRHPRATRRRVPPAPGGNRHDLSELARL